MVALKYYSTLQLLNTAITRAREWLVIIGEPVTLCTVGSNRVCWMEFIKYCCQCKSFEYPPIDSEQFETSLENKLVLRLVKLISSSHNDGYNKSLYEICGFQFL